jgi:hypothetical protein
MSMDKVDNSAEVSSAEKLASLEKAKLTRRQALSKLGFQAGAAAVAALTADELLRKVGQVMQQHAGDNRVAQQVAKEFQQAGVAFAIPPGSSCSCVPTNNPDAWWMCVTCLPSQPGSWPALNCSSIETWACCDAKYQQCVAAYTAQGNPNAQMICAGKLNECKQRTHPIQ